MDLKVRQDLLPPKLAGLPNTHHSQYIEDVPSREHYHLLAHLAAQFEHSLFVDIGTHLGYSALALSGGTNRVLTLDIEDCRGIPLPPTVECRIVNMIEDRTVFPLDAAMAVLDVDPHCGEQERAVVEQLVDRKWHGVLVCDDIDLNDGMRSFWKWAPGLEGVRQVDATDVGHSTGTGIMYF